jgi:N-acyl-D-amino-acid deacylase
MHDLIIRDVSIYDGHGGAPFRGDFAADGDTIVAVGSVPGTARETVDGNGLALAPGFIDVHTHDDFAAVLYRDMSFKTAGGVTTCVVGNCGMGAAPWAEATLMARAMHPEPLPQWDGYRGYFDRLEAEPPGVNIAALIGHGTARLAAVGTEAREPTGAEMQAMRDIVSEGLEAGTVGLSSGLIYDPGRYARTQEIVELASLMRNTGALYATYAQRGHGPARIRRGSHCHRRRGGGVGADLPSQGLRPRRLGARHTIARAHRAGASARVRCTCRPISVHCGQHNPFRGVS